MFSGHSLILSSSSLPWLFSLLHFPLSRVRSDYIITLGLSALTCEALTHGHAQRAELTFTLRIIFTTGTFLNLDNFMYLIVVVSSYLWRSKFVFLFGILWCMLCASNFSLTCCNHQGNTPCLSFGSQAISGKLKMSLRKISLKSHAHVSLLLTPHNKIRGGFVLDLAEQAPRCLHARIGVKSRKNIE